MEEKDINLSILKEYSFFYNYQKRNKENNKKDPIGVRLLYHL